MSINSHVYPLPKACLKIRDKTIATPEVYFEIALKVIY